MKIASARQERPHHHRLRHGIGSRVRKSQHIGTIAKSGTREFFQRLSADAASSAQLIGQFGVGFYASFIVADKVTLISRRAGRPVEEGVRWESAGEGDYAIEAFRKETRGTDVILHLRPAEDELLSGSRLREVLRKYSDHITVPILMKKEHWDPAARAQTVIDEDEQINQASALWARPKAEITDRAVPRVLQAPWRTTSSRRSPTATTGRRPPGIHAALLHPWRAPSICGIAIIVTASSSSPACLHHGRRRAADAAYLRFVRGVIDSSDLPPERLP